MTDRDVSPREPRTRAAFALSRLRASPILRACMMLAFLEYGMLAFLAVFGTRLRPDMWVGGTNVTLTGFMAICSLGSWLSIFAWFPFLQTLQTQDDGNGSAMLLGKVLETFAILCVAVVHGLMAWTLVRAVM